MRTLLISLSFLMFFSSCQKKNTAESQLKEFIRMRYKGDQHKTEVLKWLVDPIYSEFESIPDDEYFKKMSVKDKRLKSIRILSTNCDTKTNCFITFIIKFETLKKDKKHFTSEVKKLANLKLDGETWKIADVNNVKTFHDSHVPLEP